MSEGLSLKDRRIADPYLDRRSGDDRREAYELGFFAQGGIERRKGVERRLTSERRAQYVNVTQWSSICPKTNLTQTRRSCDESMQSKHRAGAKIEDIADKREIVIKRGPVERPYAKIFIKERRNNTTDRRTLHTFIANDRRCGIIERRKNQHP
jgi:hypothetical protein